MPVSSDIPREIYTFAWDGLLIICAFYLVIGIALRWRSRSAIRVTRYEPPKGISPSLAAYLVDGGQSERSFAAGLVSLSVKGYAQILQDGDWTTLEKLRDLDAALPVEESALLSSLFRGSATRYSFNASDSALLFEAYKDFRATVHDVATSEFMSTHGVLWLLGLIYSFTLLEPIVLDGPEFGHGLSAASIAFLVVWIFVGGSCFAAALRAWPATLSKLYSLVPGTRRKKLPFTLNDLSPFFLSVTAGFAFMFISIMTSTMFALLAAAALAMNVFSRRLLNAPTASGRKVIGDLLAFREFLARAEADRLDRENQAGKSPDTLNKYAAYAIALGVGTGWGTEFAGNILELLQVSQAFSLPGKLPEPDNTPTVLTIFDRKR